MTVRTAQLLLDARDLTRRPNDRAVSGVYAGDIMSRAMAGGFDGMAWVTAQANMNALAVAHMKRAACLIFPEDILPGEDVVRRACEENIALLGCGLSAYEAAGRLYEAEKAEKNTGANRREENAGENAHA